MAGYICKIVIEDTHPPVWRRIMLPDKITFEELHEIIQVLFGWSDMHLHEFEVPSDRIVIGSDEETWGRHYYEHETLIDPFFRNYKWIRYTYDFGDDWRHKIIIEETDQDFKSRSAVLLKFKGDNFEEDSGGIWGAYEDARYAFEKYEVEEHLKRMVFPRHEDLQETKLLKESVEDLKNLVQELMRMNPMVLQSQLANVADEIHGASLMKQKIHKWERFKEEAWDSLRLVEPVRTHKEILMDIGEKEAADYYKYLQIPREEFLLHEEEVSAIADTLREHPEYLFYIFSEKEYQELTEWIKQMPQGKSLPNPKQKNMLLKALGLGLADFACREEFGEISFASDITQLIGVVDAKTKKKEYKALAEFDDRLGKLMQVYGVIELESLYEIYKNLYGSPEDKKTFFRYVYWHARFNDFVNTAYQLDGTCYVAAKELDAYHIVESMEAYAKELPYAAYSKREIDYKGEDLANRCDWIDCLFTALRYQLNMEPYEAQEQLFRIVTVIMSGYTLNEVIEELYEEHGAKLDLETATELWTEIVGVMLEMELPMLKGRSRIQYAEEQKCSAWVVGMLSDIEAGWNKTNCRMYQFPAEIQEWMYEAGAGSVERMEQLLAYKDQNQISSEEYLFLLAEACITFGQTKRVEQLIAQLKKSSLVGKKAAKLLEERLQGRYDVFDDEEDFPDSKQWSWSEPEVVQQPYVRSTPKIGRNDPCPCGSGKKYKKCCGINN